MMCPRRGQALPFLLDGLFPSLVCGSQGVDLVEALQLLPRGLVRVGTRRLQVYLTRLCRVRFLPVDDRGAPAGVVVAEYDKPRAGRGNRLA